MNISLSLTKYYKKGRLCRCGENKPKQTQPVVSLSNLLQTQQFSKFFLAFAFLCPIYNLAMQNWTIQSLLNWTNGYLSERNVDSPRLNAEMLLSHVLGLKRIELYTHFNKVVEHQQLDRLHELVKRAGSNEPVAYLVGKTEFYSLELDVSGDCMIPRPETELLVQWAIEFLRMREGTQFVCDLCTGCGCIAIAIARNFANARIIATDISSAALRVAARNTEKHRVGDRIQLLQGDLFEPLIPHLDVGGFDLIVCNPPYVSSTEYERLDRNVKDFEPRLALFGGTDGLDVYRRIAEQVNQFLKADSVLMLEIGYAQGPTVKRMIEETGLFSEVRVGKDFHNNDRIVIASKCRTQFFGGNREVKDRSCQT